MKKQLLILSAATCMLFCNKTSAQQNKTIENNSTDNSGSMGQSECATKYPGIEWENAFQLDIAKYQKILDNNRGVQATYLIPVIVHVLYNGSTEATIGTGANIKAAQIQAQIDALNEAFAGNTPGNANLPTPFANVDANDITIRFCLAVIGKNGNTLAEPGIDRIDWKAKGWNSVTTVDGNNIQSYYDGTVKPSTIWDPTKYFNIWVGDFFTNAGGIIGYAKFPASSTLQNNFGSLVGSSQNDGVVMGTRCFGCKTKFAAGYYANTFNNGEFSYGITTVHEVGHWLGLQHISGDASCGNDYCADTPPQSGGNKGCANGLNWGCPSYPFQANKCSGNPNGEMFMNYMDYTGDLCRSLFTANQETRMMTAMLNSPNRKLLGSTNSLCATTVGLSETNNDYNLIAFPNPNNGIFNISFNSPEKATYKLELKNVLGQVVYKEELTDFIGIYAKQINVTDYVKGIYLMSLTNSKNETVKKVIVY